MRVPRQSYRPPHERSTFYLAHCHRVAERLASHQTEPGSYIVVHRPPGTFDIHCTPRPTPTVLSALHHGTAAEISWAWHSELSSCGGSYLVGRVGRRARTAASMSSSSKVGKLLKASRRNHAVRKIKRTMRRPRRQVATSETERRPMLISQPPPWQTGVYRWSINIPTVSHQTGTKPSSTPRI
jgi:hypothetical protein